MSRERKLQAPITLFASIEEDQHETLRMIAYQERRSIADVVREALSEYLKTKKSGKRKSSRLAKTGRA